MKIEWLISGTASDWIEENFQNGGYVYDTQARRALRRRHDVCVTYLTRGSSRVPAVRLLQFARYLVRACHVRPRGDVVVRDVFSTVFSPFRRGRRHLVILHHLDVAGFKWRPLYRSFERAFFRRARLADAVIVVSDHWRNKLLAAGCRRVITIHNSFDLSQFDISDAEVSALRQRLGLTGPRPILYLGNSREEKGFMDAARFLLGLEAELIVTGTGPVPAGVKQFFLPYRDYLTLLKASSVAIIMSRFAEGWNRVAHEAMLCGTPVIGSGRGGMKELLEGGGQAVCPEFADLRARVESLLGDKAQREAVGRAGREFARKFDLDSFERSWEDAIASLS